MININANSLKARLNDANPQVLADALRQVQLGNIFRAMPTTLRKKAAAANPYAIATIQTITLPDDAKAATIYNAYGRVNTGGVVAGPLTIDTPAATAPATLHCKILPTGDIALLATDGWTQVDVEYLPAKYDVVEVTLPVVAASGLCALPAAVTGPGAIILMEAEALVGTLVGKKLVVAPAASAPATTLAGFDLAKLNVFFAIADAVTSCRLKLAVGAATDVDALLTAVSNLL